MAGVVVRGYCADPGRERQGWSAKPTRGTGWVNPVTIPLMDELPAPVLPRRVKWGNIAAVAVILLAVAWCAGIGHHRHTLTVTADGRTYRFVSRRSPWEVALQGRPPAGRWGIGFRTESLGSATTSAGGRLTGEAVRPQASDGVGIVLSDQAVDVGGDDPRLRLEFSINGRPFVLTPGVVTGGGSTWTVPAGGTVDIDVDDLP